MEKISRARIRATFRVFRASVVSPLTAYPLPDPDFALTVIREVAAPGALPRYEIPGWRERFGVVAGITGRGEGEQPFDLGLWTGQPVGEVMGRWRDLRSAEPGFSSHALGNQVHQDKVLWHERPPSGWTLIEGVDGHATATPGLMLYVTVADCVPVYLVHSVSRSIALLHAGWRGVAGRILERGVATLSHQAQAPASEFIMHCGVSICGACYEVGSEVMEGLGLARSGGAPYHADLREVLSRQAGELGIQEISSSALCSAHDRPRFFSHRASRGLDGRMVAYLGVAPLGGPSLRSG